MEPITSVEQALAVVKQDAWALQFVPRAMLTDSFLVEALLNNSTVNNVPGYLKTDVLRALAPHQPLSLDCYVRVQGEASDPADEGVQGAYLTRVTLPAGAAIGKLTEPDKSAIAKAMLDSFHQHQGIDTLDDFSFKTYLENGEEIFELQVGEIASADATATSISPTATHWGKIDDRFWDASQESSLPEGKVEGGCLSAVHHTGADNLSALPCIAFVLVHPELGVYLGNALGLGFWSKLDNAGQNSAVTFPSPEAALEHAGTWDTQQDGLTTVQVNSDSGDWASIEVCVAAGLEPWNPNPETGDTAAPKG